MVMRTLLVQISLEIQTGLVRMLHTYLLKQFLLAQMAGQINSHQRSKILKTP